MESVTVPSVIVIGIGNDFRGDDAAGLKLCRRLKREGVGPATIIEHPGEGTTLMDAWDGYDRVILVDAISSGACPGAISKFDVKMEPLPSRFFSCSSHNFGVAEAVEMARALGRLPGEIFIYGIEGRSFGPGEGLSDEVGKAVAELSDEIKQILSKLFKG